MWEFVVKMYYMRTKVYRNNTIFKVMLYEFFKRAGKRALYYIKQGYSLVSLPFVFLGYAKSIDYLAIENTRFFHNIFRRFSLFPIVGGLTLPILCGLLGYVYIKCFWLFRVESDIQMDSNLYTSVRFTNVIMPAFKNFRETARNQGLIDIVEQLDQIIKRSEGE